MYIHFLRQLLLQRGVVREIGSLNKLQQYFSFLELLCSANKAVQEVLYSQTISMKTATIAGIISLLLLLPRQFLVWSLPTFVSVVPAHALVKNILLLVELLLLRKIPMLDCFSFC